MLIDQVKKKVRAIRAREVLVVIGWAVTIALITIITEYAKTPRSPYYHTSFDILDLAIVLATSLVFGIFLVDPTKIIYGFIGATILSIIISVVSSALYDLYALGLGEQFSGVFPGLEWEWVTWLAFLRIFRIMFPGAIVLIFVGGMIGGIVSDFLWPYRG